MQRQSGGVGGLPFKGQIRRGVGGQRQVVGPVGVALADVAGTAGQRPLRVHLPAQPQVGQSLGHVGRDVAAARDDGAIDSIVEVVITGTQDSGVRVEPQGGGQCQRQGAFKAARALLADLEAVLGVGRVTALQVVLGDVVGGQGPFATLLGQRLLDAHFDLAADRHVGLGAAGAHHQRGGGGVGGPAVLRIDGQGRGQCIDSAQAVAGAVPGAAEDAVPGDQVVTADAGTVMAQAGHEGQLPGDGQSILDEQGVLVGGVPVTRNEGEIAVEEACLGRQQAHVARVAGVGIVVVLQAAVIEVEAGRDGVVHAQQLALEGHVGGIARLLLVVADGGVTGQADLLVGRIPGVVLGVEPQAIAADVIEAAAHGDVVAGGALQRQFAPVVTEGDAGVLDVVVGAVQGFEGLSVDQRNAEVAHGLVAALGVAQLQLPAGQELPLQGAGQALAAVLAAVHPAITAFGAGIEPVGQAFADRAAAVEVQRTLAAVADARADFVTDCAVAWLARDDVDDAADGAITVDDGGRAPEDFDPFDGPGVEGIADAKAAILAHAVVELHDGAASGEAPHREVAAAVARMGQTAEAGGARGGFVDGGVATCIDPFAGDHVDAGRGVLDGQSQARSGRWGLLKPLLFGRAHGDGIQGLDGVRWQDGQQQQRGHDEGFDGKTRNAHDGLCRKARYRRTGRVLLVRARMTARWGIRRCWGSLRAAIRQASMRQEVRVSRNEG